MLARHYGVFENSEYNIYRTKDRKTADCFFQLSLNVNIYLKAETPQATVTTIPFTSTEGSGTGNPIRSIITLLSLTHLRDFLASRII